MEIRKYKEVQAIAKIVLSQLGDHISPDSTEESIASLAKQLLLKQGVSETWYYDVPAFVLLGSRSCLSISGKNYTPAKEKVGTTNLVTVDLSPCLGLYWGDCARSYCIENGQLTRAPLNEEFINGIKVESYLHQKMIEFVNPETTFNELFTFGNELITQQGFENLDFLGNLGHSIEQDRNLRRYIDANCQEKLGDVPLFTFEPHIRQKGKNWGFKHENIYYFDEQGKISEL